MNNQFHMDDWQYEKLMWSIAESGPRVYYNRDGVCGACLEEVHPNARRCIHCTSLLAPPPLPPTPRAPGFWAWLFNTPAAPAVPAPAPKATPGPAKGNDLDDIEDDFGDLDEEGLDEEDVMPGASPATGIPTGKWNGQPPATGIPTGKWNGQPPPVPPTPGFLASMKEAFWTAYHAEAKKGAPTGKPARKADPDWGEDELDI